jgi:hypothetical protein
MNGSMKELKDRHIRQSARLGTFLDEIAGAGLNWRKIALKASAGYPGTCRNP